MELTPGAGAGIAGLIVATALAIKYALEGWANYRTRVPGRAQPEPVKDAATTNALLLDALRVERDENARNRGRIDELEAEVEQLRVQRYADRRKFERELSQVHAQLEAMTRRVEALQQNVREQANAAEERHTND